MTVYLIAVFAGAFFLAYAPYLRKKADGSITSWNHYFTATFIMALLIAFFASAIIYLANPIDPTTDLPIAFMQGLILGASSEAIITEMAKRLFPPSTT